MFSNYLNRYKPKKSNPDESSSVHGKSATISSPVTTATHNQSSASTTSYQSSRLGSADEILHDSARGTLGEDGILHDPARLPVNVVHERVKTKSRPTSDGSASSTTRSRTSSRIQVPPQDVESPPVHTKKTNTMSSTGTTQKQDPDLLTSSARSKTYIQQAREMFEYPNPYGMTESKSEKHRSATPPPLNASQPLLKSSKTITQQARAMFDYAYGNTNNNNQSNASVDDSAEVQSGSTKLARQNSRRSSVSSAKTAPFAQSRVRFSEAGSTGDPKSSSFTNGSGGKAKQQQNIAQLELELDSDYESVDSVGTNASGSDAPSVNSLPNYSFRELPLTAAAMMESSESNTEVELKNLLSGSLLNSSSSAARPKSAGPGSQSTAQDWTTSATKGVFDFRERVSRAFYGDPATKGKELTRQQAGKSITERAAALENKLEHKMENRAQSGPISKAHAGRAIADLSISAPLDANSTNKQRKVGFTSAHDRAISEKIAQIPDDNPLLTRKPRLKSDIKPLVQKSMQESRSTANVEAGQPSFERAKSEAEALRRRPNTEPEAEPAKPEKVQKQPESEIIEQQKKGIVRDTSRIYHSPVLKYDQSTYDEATSDYRWHSGEILNQRYVLLSLLGRGTFGQVIRAYDAVNHIQVAVKIVKSGQAFFIQSEQEVRVLEYLMWNDPKDSHNLMQLYDSFIYRGHQVMVTERLWASLFDVLEKNGFQGYQLSSVISIGKQILECLKFMHQKEINLMHCDIKPENIMFRSIFCEQIKVIDLGSTCRVGHAPQTYIQSRFYRAPEVVLGTDFGSKIDVWSVGCLLIELLVGEPLFPGENEANLLAMIIQRCGLPPLSMILNGLKSPDYFDRLETGDFSLKKDVVDTLGENCLPYEPITVFVAGVLQKKNRASVIRDKLFEPFMNLVRRMLRIEPEDRIDANGALNHFVFQLNANEEVKEIDAYLDEYYDRDEGNQSDEALAVLKKREDGSSGFLSFNESSLFDGRRNPLANSSEFESMWHLAEVAKNNPWVVSAKDYRRSDQLKTSLDGNQNPVFEEWTSTFHLSGPLWRNTGRTRRKVHRPPSISGVLPRMECGLHNRLSFCGKCVNYGLARDRSKLRTAQSVLKSEYVAPSVELILRPTGQLVAASALRFEDAEEGLFPSENESNEELIIALVTLEEEHQDERPLELP